VPPGTLGYDYRLKPKLDTLASIGVIALATDATLEKDWRRLLDIPGVGFYVGRIPNSPTINRDTLTAMAAHMKDALAALLPDNALDCVVYGCTSGALFIGEQRVSALIREIRPQVRVTNPLSAARAALSAFGARRVGMLTPYLDEVNVPLAKALGDAGFEVAAMGSFFNDRDPDVVRIEPDSIRQACLKLVREAPVDALFVACTALDAAHLVPELEARTGLPVTTSNHAMGWHALRLCGVTAGFDHHGILYRLPEPHSSTG
jgi:maleate isomerase